MKRVTVSLSAVVTTLLFLSLNTQTSGADSLLPEYISKFSGRWICETTADQDIDGYWKKGDEIRMESILRPMSDLSGLRHEAHFEKEGKRLDVAHGITTWDAAQEVIKSYGFAPPGFHAATTITKVGDKWTSTMELTHPDGSKSSSTVEISLSDNGGKYTTVLTKGVDKHGEEMEKSTRVWKRISRNQEELEKHVSWLIGTWTGKEEIPGKGLVPSKATYKWIAKKHVIQMKLTIGDWEGLSMIFYDPSDDKIKMWGANSIGGNGQAVLNVNGDELVWTNTVFDGDGTKRVFQFLYIKQKDSKTMIVKYVVDGEEREVVAKKQE